MQWQSLLILLYAISFYCMHSQFNACNTEYNQFTVCNDSLLNLLHSMILSCMQESAQLTVCNDRAYSNYCLQSQFAVCNLDLLHAIHSALNLQCAMTVALTFEYFCQEQKKILKEKLLQDQFETNMVGCLCVSYGCGVVVFAEGRNCGA